MRASYELSPIERAVMSYKGTPSSFEEDLGSDNLFRKSTNFHCRRCSLD